MKLWLLVIFLALVTYIPRMLPMVLLKDMNLPLRLRTFLELIPIAALTALIFPGILYATGNVQSALAGTVVALLLAFLNANLMLVVFGSILAVFLWGFF